MYFLGLGLVLLLMKYLEIDPVVAWSWWTVFTPFGLAMAWWAWADWSGYTKKKAMEVEQARVKARHDRNRDAIGLFDTGKNKKKRR